MNHKEMSRLDRFAFALGSVTIASPYAVIPIVPNNRIAAAWDERLKGESGTAGPGNDPARPRLGWAT
jgi:hypothetical protein